MKHRRMSNKRIKQMMGDINHDGIFDEAIDHSEMLDQQKTKPDSQPDFIPDDSNK